MEALEKRYVSQNKKKKIKKDLTKLRMFRDFKKQRYSYRNAMYKQKYAPSTIISENINENIIFPSQLQVNYEEWIVLPSKLKCENSIGQYILSLFRKTILRNTYA